MICLDASKGPQHDGDRFQQPKGATVGASIGVDLFQGFQQMLTSELCEG